MTVVANATVVGRTGAGVGAAATAVAKDVDDDFCCHNKSVSDIS